MKTFLVLLQNKSITLLKNDLFVEHVQHLEQLINAENLVMHGLFSDDSGAIRVIQGKAQPEVDSLIQADPYYPRRLLWRLFHYGILQCT
jgi:uncharacterized protein YciI